MAQQKTGVINKAFLQRVRSMFEERVREDYNLKVQEILEDLLQKLRDHVSKGNTDAFEFECEPMNRYYNGIPKEILAILHTNHQIEATLSSIPQKGFRTHEENCEYTCTSIRIGPGNWMS